MIDPSIDRRDAKCLFCDITESAKKCETMNIPPPADFALASPEMLNDAISSYMNLEVHELPKEPAWPLLIPEVSDITETTSRLNVWPDEGSWTNPFWNPIAWDMTGYLFDKVRGAPWVFEPSECARRDWHEILGPEPSWIQNVLMMDRLPDAVAIQTPPFAIMVLYLNRLMTYHRKLLFDDDAPYPWLVSHGYPSYIDWPPAWHFNLGIRMLSSLLGYLASQSPGLMAVEPGALYPDKSRVTEQELPLPYVQTKEGNRLLWTPGRTSEGTTEMEWPRFPGIIPFIPGADTNQIAWFAEQMVKAGFRTFAIDALNTIAHENFDGLSDAVKTLRSVSAKRIIIYGPWPLHIPSKHRPIHGVSYIPAATHMDLTDYPSRFWRASIPRIREQQPRWQELPSYKSASLPTVSASEWIETCDCQACKDAKTLETKPQSIWRWGHLLNAAAKWMQRVQNLPEKEALITPSKKKRLWYQGPSYTVFRRCFHYPENVFCQENCGVIDTLRVLDSRINIILPDNITRPIFEIRWSWANELSRWVDGFPSLEG